MEEIDWYCINNTNSNNHSSFPDHQQPSWAQFNNEYSSSSSSFLLPYFPASNQSFPFSGFVDDRTESSSKSHSKAEKRRRDRINAQLSTLRKLIPKSDKMDKAALLGSVIEQVKDLKRKAMEVSKSLTVPTDVDEVTVESCEHDNIITNSNKIITTRSTTSTNDPVLIKASVCCEDRPEVLSELIQALKALRLTAVGVDMATLGGRIKSILLLSTTSTNDNNDQQTAVCLNSLQNSLKLVLTKIASSSSSSMTANCSIRSRRQRFFLPSD